MRAHDESSEGLGLLVPLSGLSFEVVAARLERLELPIFGAVAARELESSDADPEATSRVEAGHVFTPDLGLVDSDGYLSWLGCWRSDAASLLVAAAPGAAADSVTDSRDVPIARALRAPVGVEHGSQPVISTAAK